MSDAGDGCRREVSTFSLQDHAGFIWTVLQLCYLRSMVNLASEGTRSWNTQYG